MLGRDVADEVREAVRVRPPVREIVEDVGATTTHADITSRRIAEDAASSPDTRPAPNDQGATAVKCLIVERHAWETGAVRQQLQFPRDAFSSFFGSTGEIDVEVYSSPWLKTSSRVVRAQISAYPQSGTYRLNRVYEIASIGGVFVFVQELAEQEGVRRYSLWWNRDLAFVAAKFNNWRKARDSQYGRGRLWLIRDDEVPRDLTW